jgi:2'-5' RNA ligase
MPTVRTFIAVDLPREVKQQIGDIGAGLRPLSRSVRWVRPESLHLTLKFLGEISQERLPGIFTALSENLPGRASFDLVLADLGGFPNLRRPRVLWVGVEQGEEQLKGLQEMVEEAMVQCGFDRERRAFSPHLTIGRVKSAQGLEAVLDRLPSISYRSDRIAVSAVKVMRSQLKPTGAEYSALQVFPLEPQD